MYRTRTPVVLKLLVFIVNTLTRLPLDIKYALILFIKIALLGVVGLIIRKNSDLAICCELEDVGTDIYIKLN